MLFLKKFKFILNVIKHLNVSAMAEWW
jgi:hypothetical protein